MWKMTCERIWKNVTEQVDNMKKYVENMKEYHLLTYRLRDLEEFRDLPLYVGSGFSKNSELSLPI